MRMLVMVVGFWMLGLTALESAHAQDSTAGEVAAPSEGSLLSRVGAEQPGTLRITPDVSKAFGVWEAALQATPKLVSLRVEDKADATPRERLEARLKVLGSKTFSNREWRSYWETQRSTALDLKRALTDRPGEPGFLGGSAASRIVDGLDAWAALGKEKVANQDRYFKAIEAERDAIEERLESFLDAPSSEPVSERGP